MKVEVQIDASGYVTVEMTQEKYDELVAKLETEQRDLDLDETSIDLTDDIINSLPWKVVGAEAMPMKAAKATKP